MKNTTILIFLSAVLFSCGEHRNYTDSYDETDISLVVDSTLFFYAIDAGLIENDDIQEASGLVASRKYPNYLWTHNDSGSKAILYLINENGESICELKLKDIDARDWEDIAIGFNKKDSTNYIYVAEMGDNKEEHEMNYLYKFKEIKLKTSKKKKTYKYSDDDIETLSFVYPDGPRDAECLLFDPITEDIFIVTKREDNVHFYAYRYPQSLNKVDTLEKISTLPFYKINGGDISPDGMEVLIKDYDNIYYWKRQAGESIDELLQTEPILLPYKQEPQGESIAWRMEGDGFYTLSEERDDIPARLYFYERK